MTNPEPVQALKAKIAQLYGRRSALVADLVQYVSHARGLGDAEGLDEKVKEHLTFDVVQLIANWEQGGPPPGADDDAGVAISAIVEIEEAIAALEEHLPAH